jgi:iron complex outermembrane receptor protein
VDFVGTDSNVFAVPTPQLKERRRHLMKSSVPQSAEGGARHATRLRISPVAAACATLILSSSVAFAQQKPANLDAVTVTGIRGSIENSIAVKRNSDSIVEAISAEDIGKLPDVSIAESLARLPGLSAQRVDGRAQVISIRGLSPEFGATLLNGREQVSTGDNRGVEFDQYPSELINGATVYKTPDASLMGQGLSGTVNMKSIRPLDFKTTQVNASVRGELNSNGALNPGLSDKGNRLSLSYIDQYANNTIGLAVGYAHLDSPMQEKNYQAWWWDDSGPQGGWGTPAKTDPNYLLGGYEVGAVSASQKRDGLMAVLEYKPNSNVHSTLDLYYSKFQTRKAEVHLLHGGFNRWGGTYGDKFTATNGIVNNGTFTSTAGSLSDDAPIQQNNTRKRDDSMFALGWNTELKLDKWTAIGDLSYSKAERTDKTLELTSKVAAKPTVVFDMPVMGGGFPTFAHNVDYANPSTSLLAGAWGRLGGSWDPLIKDDLSSLKLEGKRDLDGFFSSFHTGLNYSQRNKSRDYNEGFFKFNGTTPGTVSSDLVLGRGDLSFAGIPGVVAFDTEAVLAKYGVYAPNIDYGTYGRRWTVNEKVTTAFAKLGIDTQLGSIPLKGNLGLQVVNANQHSDGFDVDNSGATPVATPVTKGTSYTDALPSLNLNAEMGSNQYVRVGLARTAARPRMDEMRAFNSAGLNKKGVDKPTGKDIWQWEGNGGNAELKPWLADSLDLSYEKYFGKRSYVAAAAFKKNLLNYIYNEVTTIEYSKFTASSGQVPFPTTMGTFTRPVNGQGGTVDGLELSLSLDAGLLAPSLDGFGLVMSGSSTRSSIKPNGPDKADGPLPGMSGQVTNVTLYYEKSGFSGRISKRHRSPFTAEITGLFANKTTETTLSDDIVDLQVGYNFATGQLKGLGVLLQVNNLANGAYESYQMLGDVRMPLGYKTYGRQVMFGINYKL